jgi:hypothetical protein
VVDIGFCSVLVSISHLEYGRYWVLWCTGQQAHLEHADQYTTKPNIYYTLGEHADQYTTKPNIYYTVGEQADQYPTTPNIYHTLDEHADQYTTKPQVVSWSACSPTVW